MKISFYRFSCPERTLKVKENDKLQFICPDSTISRNPNAQKSKLYEKAYLLDQKRQFETCNATGNKLLFIYQPNYFFLLCVFTLCPIHVTKYFWR